MLKTPPVNVKVIVRCRPSTGEDDEEGGVAASHYQLDIREPTQEIVVHNKSRRQGNEPTYKSYTFDGVCGPDVMQEELFDRFVVPIVEEALQGFNCTIFAYGQTGTGKTYTMEGEWSKFLGSEPPTPVQPVAMPSGGGGSGGGGLSAEEAPKLTPNCHYNTVRLPKGVGVIPRSIGLIFKRLNELNCESGLRVSFLEIYNEELIDLLQPAGSEKQNLRIVDNNSHMTKGLAVRGLTEIPVATLSEVYSVLNNATKKRKTAETLLNRQSSRSHSIFTIAITIKEISPDGEDVIRIGKLNLVDLAGSENIQRSGSSNSQIRTKEACLINQSLVALGRVINSLVSGCPTSNLPTSNGGTPAGGYIPYRDSKLTRLLQDSLGGHTKTCIIATITPDASSVEETLSTLDYAHRAKHIKNMPQINQRMSQKFIMRELTNEIEKLKKELLIARERSGEVHLSHEDFIIMETELSNFREMKKSYAQLELEGREMLEEIDALKITVSEYEKLKVAYSDLMETYTSVNAALLDEQNRLRIEGMLTELLSKLSRKYWKAMLKGCRNYLPILQQSFDEFQSALNGTLQNHREMINRLATRDEPSLKVLGEHLRRVTELSQLISVEFAHLNSLVEVVDRNPLRGCVSDSVNVCAETMSQKFLQFEQGMMEVFSCLQETKSRTTQDVVQQLTSHHSSLSSMSYSISQTQDLLVSESQEIPGHFDQYVERLSKQITSGQLPSGQQQPATAAAAADIRSRINQQVEQFIDQQIKTGLRNIIDENFSQILNTIRTESDEYKAACLQPHSERVMQASAHHNTLLEETKDRAAVMTESLKTTLDKTGTYIAKAQEQCKRNIRDYNKCMTEAFTKSFTMVSDGVENFQNELVNRRTQIATSIGKLNGLSSELSDVGYIERAGQQILSSKQSTSSEMSRSVDESDEEIKRYILKTKYLIEEEYRAHHDSTKLPKPMPQGFKSFTELRLKLESVDTPQFGDPLWNSLSLKFKSDESGSSSLASFTEEFVPTPSRRKAESFADYMVDENMTPAAASLPN